MDDLVRLALNAPDAGRFSPVLAVATRIDGLEGLRADPQIAVAAVEVVLDEVAEAALRQLRGRCLRQDMAAVAISAEGCPDLAKDDPHHPINAVGLLIEGPGIKGTSMACT